MIIIYSGIYYFSYYTSTSTPYAVWTQSLGPPSSYCKSFPEAAPDATVASLHGTTVFLSQETSLRPLGASVMLSTFELRYETPDSAHLYETLITDYASNQEMSNS